MKTRASPRPSSTPVTSSRRLRLCRRWRLDCGVGPIALPPASGQACHVVRIALIVDDSPEFREAAAALLAERGFDVLTTAADASEALDAATETCPDGILVDVNLPGRDGFAVAASLAAACPGARIVLTSANVAHVPPEVLRECAAIAFVLKEELADVDLAGLFMPEGT